MGEADPPQREAHAHTRYGHSLRPRAGNWEVCYPRDARANRPSLTEGVGTREAGTLGMCPDGSAEACVSSDKRADGMGEGAPPRLTVDHSPIVCECVAGKRRVEEGLPTSVPF
jgi:hypothetical protein